MRFQGKPGSLQLSYREKGRRVRDTRLLGALPLLVTSWQRIPLYKYRTNPQKRDFQEQIQARTVREMQGREAAAPCEHTQHSTPNIPASIPHTPGTFTSTHPQLHSPPTMQKQGPALQRERRRYRNNSERRRKAGTDGRGPRKAARLKLETRILDEEDQGKSRTSIR